MYPYPYQNQNKTALLLALTLVLFAQRTAQLRRGNVGLDLLAFFAENNLHAALAAFALRLVAVPGLVTVHTSRDGDTGLRAVVEPLVEGVVLAHPEA